jgi:hypothetical protein
LTVRKIREVLRLHFESGFNHRRLPAPLAPRRQPSGSTFAYAARRDVRLSRAVGSEPAGRLAGKLLHGPVDLRRRDVGAKPLSNLCHCLCERRSEATLDI